MYVRLLRSGSSDLGGPATASPEKIDFADITPLLNVPSVLSIQHILSALSVLSILSIWSILTANFWISDTCNFYRLVDRTSKRIGPTVCAVRSAVLHTLGSSKRLTGKVRPRRSCTPRLSILSMLSIRRRSFRISDKRKVDRLVDRTSTRIVPTDAPLGGSCSRP